MTESLLELNQSPPPGARMGTNECEVSVTVILPVLCLLDGGEGRSDLSGRKRATFLGSTSPVAAFSYLSCNIL